MAFNGVSWSNGEWSDVACLGVLMVGGMWRGAVWRGEEAQDSPGKHINSRIKG